MYEYFDVSIDKIPLSVGCIMRVCLISSALCLLMFGLLVCVVAWPKPPRFFLSLCIVITSRSSSFARSLDRWKRRSAVISRRNNIKLYCLRTSWCLRSTDLHSSVSTSPFTYQNQSVRVSTYVHVLLKPLGKSMSMTLLCLNLTLIDSDAYTK